MAEMPSLDHEPNLEFDDEELVMDHHQPPTGIMDCHQPPTGIMDRHQLPTGIADGEVILSCSDGTIDENFEEELGSNGPVLYTDWQLGGHFTDSGTYKRIEPGEEDFGELVNTGLVEVAGLDHLGRVIVVISACLLPSVKVVPPDVLFRYLASTLETYVEQDYTIVYLHAGMKKESKPPLSWFWSGYKALDRKFKKNLKNLYLVHPTNMIRILWRMFQPIISVKFGSKMTYCNYLYQLRENLRLDNLPIPDAVREYDRQLLAKDPSAAAEAAALEPAASETVPRNPFNPPPTKQIGVSLQFIRDNNPDMQNDVPPIVRVCVDYLLHQENLATEGIFRRSVTKMDLLRMMDECDQGREPQFNNDPHCAAALLKAFLRSLEEPLLTFQLYDEIVLFPTWPMHQRQKMTQILLLEKLPIENYRLLKYIIQFLWRVSDMSCLNKMTANNLAVVFGPNFVWPPTHSQLSLQYVIPINQFIEYLLRNHETLFIV